MRRMKELDYLSKGVRLTNYCAMPNEMFDMAISSTAKLVYARLLSRAQLSVNNGFVDEEGKAYVLYPVEDIAKDMNKGLSSVKEILKELEEAELIERKRHPSKRMNMIYVKIPKTSLYGQISGCIKPENKLSDGRKTGFTTVGKSAPSNNIYKHKEIPNYNYVEGESL